MDAAAHLFYVPRAGIINKDIKSIRIGNRAVWQIYRYDLKNG